MLSTFIFSAYNIFCNSLNDCRILHVCIVLLGNILSKYRDFTYEFLIKTVCLFSFLVFTMFYMFPARNWPHRAIFAHMRGARNGFCRLRINKKTTNFRSGHQRRGSRPETLDGRRPKIIIFIIIRALKIF